jgi:hypothetical protein
MTAETFSDLEPAEGVEWNVCQEPDVRCCTVGAETDAIATAPPERSPVVLTEW